MLSGGAPTLAGTSLFTMRKICTHMEYEVNHNDIKEWGTFGSMDGAFIT